MEWKDIIAKLRLVDVSPELKGDQVGGINVKVENNTYNINLPSGMGRGAMEAVELTPEFEREVKREAARRLIELGISPDLLSEGARIEVANATTAVSAVDSAWKRGGAVNFSSELSSTVSSKSKEPKE